ncbi:PREDICTED: uncharacterized protein LOC108560234 [Nicrophorus vespilloides]|uniref:Uncharacterized protein LOC108560234 n=1 Tax=Nicrophorus vespilloides TaxID=110193 RepID=A0ABM1MF32_NICVS|nr:PREDICTED: uncharacterized protein LOC108560234 [Nicrophorus vespilloides]
MEGKIFVQNNTTADLMQSWHIPRPTLARSSNSSQGSTSGSTNSTQSARSGSLLLTAANLAQIHKDSTKELTTRDDNIKYFLESSNSNPLSIPITEKKTSDPDSVSIASSMHFTVVNVHTRPTVKKRSFCKKHQLTILVVSMSAIFTFAIIMAIFALEMRARRQPPH